MRVSRKFVRGAVALRGGGLRPVALRGGAARWRCAVALRGGADAVALRGGGLRPVALARWRFAGAGCARWRFAVALARWR
jgi:hypothetical protein